MAVAAAAAVVVFVVVVVVIAVVVVVVVVGGGGGAAAAAAALSSFVYCYSSSWSAYYERMFACVCVCVLLCSVDGDHVASYVSSEENTKSQKSSGATCRVRGLSATS